MSIDLFCGKNNGNLWAKTRNELLKGKALTTSELVVNSTFHCQHRFFGFDFWQSDKAIRGEALNQEKCSPFMTICCRCRSYGLSYSGLCTYWSRAVNLLSFIALLQRIPHYNSIYSIAFLMVYILNNVMLNKYMAVIVIDFIHKSRKSNGNLFINLY